jgi:ubiquinone/menaquinone biosynthesis C-methylase UbiE
MEPKKFFWPVSTIYSYMAATMDKSYADIARRAGFPSQARSLLDVGGGDGRLAVVLANAYPHLDRIISSDIAASMVNKARKRAEANGLQARVTSEIQDAHNLTYQDATFDCVVSSGAMHHWPDPARALREMGRVLKPGGSIFIFDGYDRPSLKQIRKEVAAAGGGTRLAALFLWIGSKDVLPLATIEQAVKDSGVEYLHITLEGARLFIQGTRPEERES